MGAAALKRWVASALASAWVSRLDPVSGRVFGLRLGKALALPHGHGLSFWGGAMQQSLVVNTRGHVRIDVDAHWMLRSEFGFIGRYSLLLGFSYRFGLGLTP